VRVVLEGVDKYNNLFGSVMYPEGDKAANLGEALMQVRARVQGLGVRWRVLGQHNPLPAHVCAQSLSACPSALMPPCPRTPRARGVNTRTRTHTQTHTLPLPQAGLGRAVEWSLNMMTNGAMRLRDMERTAKQNKRGIWLHYVPQVRGVRAAAGGCLAGVVVRWRVQGLLRGLRPHWLDARGFTPATTTNPLPTLALLPPSRPSQNTGQTKLSDSFVGKVVEVVSGDTLVVKDINAGGQERRISLSRCVRGRALAHMHWRRLGHAQFVSHESCMTREAPPLAKHAAADAAPVAHLACTPRSVRAPRAGGRDRAPEPHGLDAREFLRKKLIGKEVRACALRPAARPCVARVCAPSPTAAPWSVKAQGLVRVCACAHTPPGNTGDREDGVHAQDRLRAGAAGGAGG
jgi:endonuclease YncB( thermonuclease family)